MITFTILFEAIEGWSFSDALYMTVITLTTVGYGEVRSLDEAGRLVAMAAAVVGTALIFGGVGIMAEAVLAEIGSGRRERRKMEEQIAGMSDHYIVCGYGRVGSTVTAELRGSGGHLHHPVRGNRGLVILGRAVHDRHHADDGRLRGGAPPR